MVPFSAVYMHLNVWHFAGSDEESEDRLNASHLLFVNISEMSDVIPVAVQHPVLLDVASKEAMEGTGEPVSSFLQRLQTPYRLNPATWRGVGSSYPFPSFPRREQLISAGIQVREVSPGPEAGQKIVLSLKPPTKDHWNIASDLVLLLTLDASRQRCEAKWAAQGLEGRSGGGGQRCLQQRHLLLGSLLKLRWKAVVRHSQ